MAIDARSNAESKVGLVLTGGGARGAYQAGALLAIAEIRSETPGCRPISVISGVSAGAINAAFMAASPLPEIDAAEKLVNIWRSLESKHVFKTDAASLSKIGFQWFADAAVGALYKRKMARSLLDTSPLSRLLAESISFEELPKRVEQKHIAALAITALDYTNAHNLSWVQAPAGTADWTRARRRSAMAPIGVEHVMASSAIPLFFPPVRVGDSYFGDGCLRNTAPLSPAIHLGANKLLVISVRRPDSRAAPTDVGIEPSIARILGVMLNALFMDAIEFDMERLGRINSTLDYIPGNIRSDLSLHRIEQFWIRPSEDIGAMAGGEFKNLPNLIRYLMGGLGNSRESSELTSYLLFDPEYCGKLTDLGYNDTKAQAEDIKKFLTT